ncbi:glutathione S-transferase [Diaporthe sp. PMI_573]|nr:glutathione S-transferase [Diaporthaceae sp. PMI_573]
MSKPIIVHTHGGPNPWKVVIVLEELGVPYECRLVADVKGEAYTKINPNGRTPAIEDPNTGITLWESGAILEYLVDTYDKDHKISYASFPEKYHTKQYLHFQMSGQGPYFGQTTWFRHFHPEKVESAKKRYDEQLVRVVGVLDNILAGKQYLVGDKPTYADFAFVTWDNAIAWIFGEEAAQIVPEDKYPNFFAWHKRLVARPSVQTAIAEQGKARAQAYKK